MREFRKGIGWVRKVKLAVGLVVVLCSGLAYGLSPNEILVIANSNNADSIAVARYYCLKRGVPSGNVVPVSLGQRPQDTIARSVYEGRLARPLRRLFATRDDMSQIKCLVTTYGVPYRVGGRGPDANSVGRLTDLRRQLQEAKYALDQLEATDPNDAITHESHRRKVALLDREIGRINGKETGAAIDSELSMVLFDRYELYQWQPNFLAREGAGPYKTLMVSRLDGPTPEIAKGLVDKALQAEASGLHGTAYIDSRGMFNKGAYGYYDQSLRDLALVTQLRTKLPVKEERTGELFEPGSCPEAALYCGWYSLKKYIDAFDFVPGAVGFHIASFEAVHLRSSETEWCPAMLNDGITATLGPVGEPYLHAFPEPKLFFTELFKGSCLVEAYYHTKPFNSWQMLLIGDPLYRPFKKD